MVFRKAKNIPDYEVGENVNDLFVVRFKKPVRTAKNGNYFFQLKIQDARGDSMLTYFGGASRAPVQELYDLIESDAVIKVSNGKCGDYNNKLSFSVDSRGKIEALELGDFDVSDFIRTSEREREEMLSEIKSMIDEIKDENVKKLVNSFYGDTEFLERFSRAPGAMYRHHGWISGLIEHTLTVACVARAYADLRHEIDKDLVTAGALLHDIGKLKELEMTTMIKVSDEGNLLGHVVIGIQMATERFKNVLAPSGLKTKLIHMMASHHGELEWGAPKQPAFPEALVVHKADSMDARVAEMADIRASADTEDSFFYDKKFGNIYLK